MPDATTISTAQAVKASNTVNNNINSTVDQLLANDADSQTISDSTADTQENIGSIKAGQDALTVAGRLVEQNRNVQNAAAAGITDSSNSLADILADMHDQFYAKRQYLDDIDNMTSGSIFDDPIQYIGDQLVNLPNAKKSYNMAASKLTVDTQGYSAITNAIIAGANVNKAIATSLDAGSADAAADLAVQQAGLLSNTAKQDAIKNNSASLLQVQQLNEAQLQNTFRSKELENADRSYNLQAAEFAQRTEQFNEAMDLKKQGKLQDAQLLGYYNLAQAKIGAATVSDPATFAIMMKLDKGQIAAQVNNGLALSQSNGTAQVAYGASTPQALATIANSKGQLPATMKESYDWSASQVNNIQQGINPTTGKPEGTKPATFGDVQQKLIANAQGAQLSLNGVKGSLNPYELPPLTTAVLSGASLQGTPFAQIMAANATNATNTIFNPQQTLAELATNVSRGTISIEDAAHGMSLATKALILQNNELRGFKTLALPEQTTAQAKLVLPGTFGDTKTGKPVNLTDETAVKSYLMQYAMKSQTQQLTQDSAFAF